MFNNKLSNTIFAFIVCLITAFIASCSSFPVGTPVDSGGRVINAWDESGQARAIIRDGKEYYVLTDNFRSGPYDYVEYERKSDAEGQSIYFFYKKNNQYFLTDGKEKKYGPYSDIYSCSTLRRKGIPGKFFFCKHTADHSEDIFFDNGKKLEELGHNVIKETERKAYLSDDSLSSLVCTYFDSSSTGILFNNIPIKLWSDKCVYSISKNATCTNNGVWLMGPEFGGIHTYTLRFVPWNKLNKNGLPEVRILTEPGYKEDMGLCSLDYFKTPGDLMASRAELINRFNDSLVTHDGTHVAFRYETRKGAYIFVSGTTGNRRIGPLNTTWENKKYENSQGLNFSSDGKALAYFYDDKGRSYGDENRYYIGKNDKTYGPYEMPWGYRARLSSPDDPLFIEGTHDIVYCAMEENDIDKQYYVYLNGKKILGPWNSWFAAQLVKTTGKAGERFDGYIQVCHKEKCFLYKLDKLVAGPYDWNEDSKKKFFVVNTPAGERIFFNESSATTKMAVSDDGKLSAYRIYKDYRNEYIEFGDKRLGPYNNCSNPRFIPGTTDMIFVEHSWEKPNKSYLVYGNGTRVCLPGMYYNWDQDTLTVSPDGKVIEIRMDNQLNKEDIKDFDTRYVVINNRAYVGRYNEFTNITVYWDDREQKLKKIVHK